MSKIFKGIISSMFPHTLNPLNLSSIKLLDDKIKATQKYS